MNRVCLVGRLTTKPELRTVGNGLATTRFTLAVNRAFSGNNGEREADFITIVAWRKQAENICQYLDKGSLVSVDGRIQTGSYERDGQRVYTTEVVADQVNFLESRSQRAQSASMPQEATPYDYPVNNAPVNNVSVESDPFADFGDTVSIDDNFLD